MNEYRLILKPGAPSSQNPRVDGALRRGATEREIARLVSRIPAELSRFYYFLDHARHENLIHYALVVDSRTIATVEPLTGSFAFKTAPLPRTPLLSRFAYLRRVDDSMLLESPLSEARVRLEPASDLSSPALVEMLHQTGFIEDAAVPEPEERSVWEFHDYLFHRASRHCGEPGTVGGTYRFDGLLPPWPAIRPPHRGKRIALARTDLRRLPRKDLTRVLEGRRSVRQPGGRLLTLGQLSEFLYRTAAIRQIEQGEREEIVRRVFPSGGGIHELEFYLTVDQCDGLPRGFYHYHAAEHALYKLAASRKVNDSLRERAAGGWRGHFPMPQALITLAARFPRIAWKYQGMAYRTVLLNAGAALQTMYLVATAMGLAPCAIGNGDPDLFATAAGVDAFSETSVAEFALSGAGDSPARGT